MLRVLFRGAGTSVPLTRGERIASSRLIEVETFRAVDRLRLLGAVDDSLAARKRKELGDLLAPLDLVPVGDGVIARAKDPFGINVRALDALHVATAELLVREGAGEPLEFWTHDARQADAARARGLMVRGG